MTPPAVFTILPVKQGCLFITCGESLATSVSTQREETANKEERDRPLVQGHHPLQAGYLPPG